MENFSSRVNALLSQRMDDAVKRCAHVQKLYEQSDAMRAAGARKSNGQVTAAHTSAEQIQRVYKQCGDILKKLEQLNSSSRSAQSKRFHLSNELNSFFFLIVEYIFGGTRREQIATLDSELAEFDRQAATLKENLGKGLTHQQAQAKHLLASVRAGFNDHTQQVSDFVNKQEPSDCLGWLAGGTWDRWTPPEGVRLPVQLRVGEFHEQCDQLLAERLSKAGIDGNRVISDLGSLRPLALPAFVPFVGAEKCYLIECDDGSFESSVAFVNGLILRISTLLPNQSRFTLIDPSGHGRSFPLRRLLQDVRESEEQVYAELRHVVRDIRRINEDVLGLVERFDLLPATTRASEKFEFVFCADFPNGYDRRAIDELFNIAGTGPRAGRYVFLQHNNSHPLPRDVSVGLLRNAIRLRHDSHPQVPPFFSYQADSLPPETLVQQLLTKIDDSKPPEHAMVWQNTVAIPESEWWSQSSQEIIRTPVGGSQQEMEIWFGVNEEGRPCVHGTLAAMPGSGKSNLYHVLVAGLSLRYSPNELRFYLM